MGGTAKYDYTAMEAEFVAGDMTIRALAIKHGVAPNNVSTVHDMARKRDWVEKREQYRAKTTNRAIELSVDKGASRITRRMEVQDHAVETIDRALTKLDEDMKRTHWVERGGQLFEEPVLTMRPNDIVQLLDRLQTALGQPSLITEERRFGIDISGTADLDTLKELARGLREVPRGAGAGATAGGSALPSAPGPRN